MPARSSKQVLKTSPRTYSRTTLPHSAECGKNDIHFMLKSVSLIKELLEDSDCYGKRDAILSSLKRAMQVLNCDFLAYSWTTHTNLTEE